MHTDTERCVRAVQSKDARFDGWFFTAVLTTGIYCRPSCPVVPPKPGNMTFYPSAAACQQAGFRACKRCRPDTSPGSPEWNRRADLTARAMRLIADGVVDREGVPGLASRLGYSTRQVERQLLAELGAGPRPRPRTARPDRTAADRDHPAAHGGHRLRGRLLLHPHLQRHGPRGLRPLPERTAHPRPQEPPRRHRPRRPVPPPPLPRPLNPDNLFGHLAATAVPGVEEWRDGAYRRTLRLPYGHGIVALTPNPDHIACRLTLSDLRDLTVAISRCRRLLDLDADPTAIDDQLRADPLLAPLVDKAPGRRVPRTVDEAEFAVRAVLGQQVSTAAARTHAARLVTAHGDPVDDPEGGLTHLFPSTEALAAVDPETLAMPRTRRTTFTTLVAHLADGSVNPGVESDWAETRARLLALPGFGPWTADVIAMRALGDPDAFLPTDLGIRRAAAELGLPSTPAALTARAAAWRPWRAYAVQYLWATDDHPINFLPV